MNRTVADGAAPCPHNVLEHVRPQMAKTDLKDLEKAGRRAFGRVLRRAIQLAGLTADEARARLGEVVEGGQPIDAAQLSRWFSGDENAHVWRFMLDRELRDALRLAEAEDAGHVVVETVIRIVRTA